MKKKKLPPPLDPKAAELLSMAPEEALSFKGGRSAEELGLKPDPTKPPTQFPEQGQRGRLVVFFAQEHFRGEDRILLDKGGSLPAMRLPDEHGAADFVQAHALELFNSPILNCGQIGSIEGPGMDLYVVTGDILQPAGCLDRERTPKALRWVPRSEIVRLMTLQSVIIALSQTRMFGWHIVDEGTDEFKFNFRMHEAPLLDPRPGNPELVPCGI